MSDPIVNIEHLGKVYEPFPPAMRLLLRTSVKEPVVALDDVSLQVHPGELMAVLGPNGAGKSTMFRILTGLTTPTSGSATVTGLNSETDSTAVRRVVGFMPAENRTLMLRHSARENLLFHGRLQGISRHTLNDRVDETLELVGLGHAGDRVGFALSSGMLARLLLARAILHEPAVLILDEPTGAVDPIGAFELLGLIKDIAKRRGLAVLISSHRLDEVEMLDERVVLLNRGRVLYSGDLANMSVRAVRPGIEIRFEDDEDARKGSQMLRGRPDIDALDVDGDTLHVTTELSLRDILGELNGHLEQITSIGRTNPRLRDVLREMLDDGDEA